MERMEEWRARPRIFHTEEGDEGTVYHLRVNGVFVASANWPHPLYAMEPTAISGGEIGGGSFECGPAEDGLGFLDDWTH